MVWYYSYSYNKYNNYHVYDINGTYLCSDVWHYFPFKVESKYRYSGLLYDKLRCLLSYKYHNTIHEPYGIDRLHGLTTRFHMKLMEFQYYNVNHYENTSNIAGSTITVITNRTLYFIDN